MNPEMDIAASHASVYKNLYDELNPQDLLEVDANTVASFLKRSGLGVLQLSQIWEMSDYRKKGFLDKLGIYTAFKLIAAVQQNHPLDMNVIKNSNIDAPKFSNVHKSSLASSPVAPDSNFRPQRSPSVASKTSLSGDWDIYPAEQSKYETIFYSLNPLNGKLSGEQCRPVLLNSQLPQTHLAKIWELADVDRDGQLDKYEMCIALHLVCKCLQGEPLPDRVPVALIHPMKRVQCSIYSSASVTPPPTVAAVNSPAVTIGGPSRRVSNTSVPVVSSLPKLAQGSRTSSITSLTRTTSGGEFKSIFDQKNVPADTSAPWPVDVLAHETLFQKIDLDQDGLISGTDARTHAMGCGLPQPVLAQIWALVDMAKAGRLNLEQFALWNELIKECQNGVQLPEQLPLYLIPPSLRSRNAVSRVSSSGNSMSNVSLSGGLPQSATNPRIAELTEEIEKAMENRRKAEQDLFQLEADTLVKNSEIKNLELEFQTLATTVKQLQHQKSEANKRLLDLDTKISKLEGVCAEHSTRKSAEEERLNKVKSEIAQANENFNTEEEILKKLRSEASVTDEKYSNAQKALAEENAKIEKFVDELTLMERQSDASSAEITRVENLTKELSELLEKLEQKGEEENGMLTDEEIVLKHFERITLSADGIISQNSTPKAMFPAFVSDPFKDDPFANADEVKSGFGVDPFGMRSSLNVAEDPFSSSTAPNATTGEEFADFTKFASFAS